MYARRPSRVIQACCMFTRRYERTVPQHKRTTQCCDRAPTQSVEMLTLTYLLRVPSRVSCFFGNIVAVYSVLFHVLLGIFVEQILPAVLFTPIA